MIASSPIIHDAGDDDAGDQQLDERRSLSILPRQPVERLVPTFVSPKHLRL